MQKLQELRRLSTKEVMAILNISRTTLYRWHRAGLMPMRRKIGPGKKIYLEADIAEFLQESQKVK